MDGEESELTVRTLRADDLDRLVFMDFLTDKTENVYPMVPAGAGQNEMILV